MTTQTEIVLKNSGSTGNTPSSGVLAHGELAINYADGKLFYKTPANTVSSYSIVVPGINKDVIFNDNGVYGTSAGITFDKSTANLAVSNVITTSDFNVNNVANITSGEYTTANTDTVIIDTSDATLYRTIKYSVQLTYGSQYHSEEITIVHNGSSVHIVEYGVIYAGGSSLGSFDAYISGSEVRLLFVPINTPTTIKFIKTTIVV